MNRNRQQQQRLYYFFVFWVFFWEGGQTKNDNNNNRLNSMFCLSNLTAFGAGGRRERNTKIHPFCLSKKILVYYYDYSLESRIQESKWNIFVVGCFVVFETKLVSFFFIIIIRLEINQPTIHPHIHIHIWSFFS